MAAAFSLSLLFVFVLVIAVAGGLLAVVLWFRRRSARGSDLPTCGRCGYAVRGVPTFTCPECGADLREVGIFPPGSRRGLGPAAWIFAWTLILPGVAFAVTALATKVLPVVRTAQGHRVVFIHRFAESADKRPSLPPTIDVGVEGRQWGWPWSSRTVPLRIMRLTLPNTPGQPMLHVDVASGVCSYVGADGHPVACQGELDERVLVAWLQSSGFAPQDGEATQLVPHVLTAINETRQGKSTFTKLAPDPHTHVARVEAHPSFVVMNLYRSVVDLAPLGVLGFWLLVWLAGVLLIRRRLRRAPATAPVAASEPARERGA